MAIYFFREMGPLQRVTISLGLSLLTFFLIRQVKVNVLIFDTLLWDVFALSYIIISWIIFYLREPLDIRNVARKQDGSNLFVFIFILLASFVSMMIVILIVLSIKSSHYYQGVYLPIALSGIVLSWIIVHTTFAFHYAHLYYGNDKSDNNLHAGGLDFPNDKKPDYWDFAYYAFVIGMTFQVSDVNITSKKIRRVTLMHGLLSFGLNTVVVALAVNIVAGLKY